MKNEIEAIKNLKAIDEVSVEYNPITGKYEVQILGIDNSDTSVGELFTFDNKQDAYDFQDIVSYFFMY
jgi:hypothetical protein